MMKLLQIFLILFYTGHLYAQEPATVKPNKKVLAAAEVKSNAKKLKEGGLLVRLKTKAYTIESLKNSGKEELARKTELDQLTFNKAVIAAFMKYYTLGPVYFFLSDYSEQVKAKKFNEVVFVNDSLQPDPSIVFNTNDFLTAEIGMVAEMGIDALVVMDDQFIQMKKPFPYYVRTYNDLPLERNLSRVVTLLQRKFQRYARYY